MQNSSENYLTRDEECLLLRIARETLEIYLREKRTNSLENYELTTALRDRHGAFVTINRHGRLRGCIGFIANTMPLVEAVRENVINAAARDPRFPPVTEAELADIDLEISALAPGETPETPFRPVLDIAELVIGRDGLYIERSPNRGGILLPQVAVENGMDVEAFLEAVCQKAGLEPKAWEAPDTCLSRFSAQVFSEKAMAQSQQGDNT